MAVPGLLLTVVRHVFITHCGLGMAVPGLLLTVVWAWLSQVYY